MKKSFWVAAILFIGIYAVPVSAQLKEYVVTFRVVSSVNNTPLPDATVKVTGGRIFDVAGPPANVDLIASGIRPNEAGVLIFYAAPGQFTVTIERFGYESKVFAISVPAKGFEGNARQDYGDIVLKSKNAEVDETRRIKKDEKEDPNSRVLTVTVLGQRRSASGSVRWVPLNQAPVKVQKEEENVDGGLLFVTERTNGSGIATFRGNYRIGDELKVTASAEGYETRQLTITVGSRQNEGTVKSGLAISSATFSDNITVQLSELPKAAPFTLIVEAVNSETRAAVAGARVEIELIGGSQVAAANTNVQGRTRPLVITPLPSFSKHAQYRAKVSARGFKEKWSDIPDDLVLVGESGAPYVVHLDPIAKERTGDARDAQSNNNLPPQFKGKQIARTEKLEYVECWSPANTPCDQPTIETSMTVYHFVGGGAYWDRAAYDRKRKAQADVGLKFAWACEKRLWRNGRCG